MLGQIFSGIGSAIGNTFGGGILSTIGRYAGKWLGDYLDGSDKKRSHSQKEEHEVRERYTIKNLRESFHFSKAVYGETIPLIFGSSRIDGKIFWAEQIKKVENTSSDIKYFASGETKSITHITICEYYLSYALSLCEGEIAEIGRVWANDELINLGDYNFRLYHGSDEQLPDPLILQNSENHQAPAFRGLAYIVFEELPLADFGDNIPIFSFEIIRKANIKVAATVEDVVKSMIMIPGSGEFVYDTILQHKLVKNQEGITMSRKVINSHNYRNLPNSIHSLNQLQLTCSNVEWVAPVACWFGDNLDAAKCRIRPAVEFNDPDTEYTEEWKVGQYRRDTAMLISRDKEGNPTYGGSINDRTMLRYLEELRARGLKIMFYPMFLMDTMRKPWRGHLTGDPASVADFFTRKEGYNEFILHYANLVKDHVDAFVIGTELIGLTQVRDGKYFPAVAEFVKLAKIIKELVGDKVKTIYAADWSEYHHTEGGWYNLDPLWASPYLDYIGIDAYFPVTRTTCSNILPEEMVKGWQSGEGYDHYYDEAGNKQPLTPDFAWKNIRHWWENRHRNPDGAYTDWQPKMKKIWFTEFGFPSIDKSTNQPNVFFDPMCSDGGVPRYSSGETNFSIQRKAIKIFIEYWQSQEYMEQLFLWTWDARPYPAWPHMNIWRDGYLWEKGHWVNNKFGAASLAAILLELSHRCGIKLENIDVSSLDESVEGLVLKNQQAAIDTINLLRIGHFFDIVASSGSTIKFIKRGQAAGYPISKKMLIKLNNNSFLEKREIPTQQIISKLELYFIDHSTEYNYNYCQLNSENFSSLSTASIQLPISMSIVEAENLGKLILKNALIEDKIVHFILPLTSLEHEPSDIVTLHYMNYQYQIRIIEIKLKGLIIEVTGIFDDGMSYAQISSGGKQDLIYEVPVTSKFTVLDLPFIFPGQNYGAYVAVYLQNNCNLPLYASLSKITSYSPKIANLKSEGSIGTLIGFEHSGGANIFLIDEHSSLTVLTENFTKAVQAGWNLALCGGEIISFRKWQLVGEHLYQISSFIRGQFATEDFMDSHASGEQFVLLSRSVNIIPVSNKLKDKNIYFKTRKLEEIRLPFKDNSSAPPSPFLEICAHQGEEVQLKWRARTRIIDDWRGQEEIIKYEFVIDIASSTGIQQFVTRNSYLNINIKEQGLSGTIKINIMAKDEMGNLSLPKSKTVEI